MLFYGPPGTGKTSTILALARQLFGPDNFKSRVLELNASDERGISIIREKVKNFARQTPRAQGVALGGKTYPCPPYKIIILDEADSMTQDAQGALRRIMEAYARITRFCLVCNYVTRFVVIPPLHNLRLKCAFRAESSSRWHRAVPSSGSNLLIRAPLPPGSRRSRFLNRWTSQKRSSQFSFQPLLAISVDPSHTFNQPRGSLPQQTRQLQLPRETSKRLLVSSRMKP